MGIGPEDLLPDQRRAVTHRDCPLLVVGVAGAGKTKVLAMRFVWLAAQGVRPERLAIVAPSPAHAGVLRRAVEEQVNGPYEELHVSSPAGLAARILEAGGPALDPLDSVLDAGERFAMLLERIDELSLERHDFGGSARSLLAGFVRRIDTLKAHLIGAEDYARWAAELERRADEPAEAAVELEFAEVYRAHERMLAEAGFRDAGDLIRDALAMLRERPALAERIEGLLVDDAHELQPAAAELVRTVGAHPVTATVDPTQGFFSLPGAHTVRLTRSMRCADKILAAARSLVGVAGEASGAIGEVRFWRCAGERAQAQAVAADIERLIQDEGVAPEDIAVFVPAVIREGQAVAVALQERAVPHRVIGEAAFFQRAEIRDLLAWLRLLADPSDAAAVVRALARPPIELRSVDIARCTQIARRRKLDMVAALAAALESPQVPPEARERIHTFLKLYRSGTAALDTTRPDLYVHRLTDRLGLRRHQLFAAQASVVERLQALAAFGELASTYSRRSPQGTPRQFAHQIAAVAESGLRDAEDPDSARRAGVRVLGLDRRLPLEAEHVYVVGLHGALAPPTLERIPAALRREGEDLRSAEAERLSAARFCLYFAATRARSRVVLAYPSANDRGALLPPWEPVEQVRMALGGQWEDKEEELFGPAETLHSTYRLLLDELLEGTMRAGGRLAELRFDTDLDVAHAVVRYLELLKVAALIARPEGQSLAEALRDVNARILQAVTAEQREILTSSVLDEYLLDADRGARRRSQALAARDEPTLEPFLPKRGDGVVLSASDIDTYRTCPLKYKFARVFRIPQEPTIHQRFGIVLHQVLERFHAGVDAQGSLSELLGLLDASWRRGGFGDSEEERQLRGKASAALVRYHERFQNEDAQPVWFERAFTFKLGPHLLRGRVDRVDRLPDGEYELIDYKTGRPKSQAQLAEDVQLSLYAVGAREAWSLESSQQAYYYLLDDEKVALPGDGVDRSEWVREVAVEVAEGILTQGFEPTPSFAACSVCDYRVMCPAAER